MAEILLAGRAVVAIVRAMSPPVLESHALSKRYGQVVAVDDLSFSVRAGETMALLGANGAGKTTTMAMVMGLLLPSSGSIHVFGEDLARNRYRLLRRMNFSSPYVDLPHRLTVNQNLTVYARLYGLDDVRARIERIAEELEITPFLRRQTGKLSAGQKTRVALAKALINEPELLLLDEPSASLDPDTADWVRGYLERYRAATGASILLASHNMAEVERLCDSVIMLRAGRMVDRDTPAGLIARYGRQNLEEVFLDIARGKDGVIAEAAQ